MTTQKELARKADDAVYTIRSIMDDINDLVKERNTIISKFGISSPETNQSNIDWFKSLPKLLEYNKR